MPTFVDTTSKVQSRRKFRNPDDPEDFVEYPITDQLTFADPKDESQEIVFRFNNGPQSGRAVRVQKLKRVEGSPADYEIIDDMTIDVERPLRVGVVDAKSRFQGVGLRFDNRDEADSWPMKPEAYADLKSLGFDYVRRVVRYCKDNKLDGTPWVDVELIEIFPVRDPKSNNQERLHRIVYAERGPVIDDEDDPYRPTFAFCDPTLPEAEEGEKTDPVRSSPFENPVNFNFAKPDILVIVATQSFSSQVDYGLEGPVKFSVTAGRKKADGVTPLYPPLTNKEFIAKVQFRTDPPPEGLLPVPIKDPLTGDMRSRLLAWTRQAAKGDGRNYIDDDADNTTILNGRRAVLYVNLTKLFKTKDKSVNAHGDVIVSAPGFNKPAFEILRQYTVPIDKPELGTPGDFFQYVNGDGPSLTKNCEVIADLGYENLAIGNNFTGGFVPWGPTEINYNEHHLEPGTERLNGTFVEDEFFVPATFSVNAYTFRDVKNFPIDAENGSPVIPPPGEDDAPEAIGGFDHQAVFLTPLNAGSIRVRVKFPGLHLEVSAI